MATNDEALTRVREALAGGNCGRAISEMETYLAAWPDPQTAERLRQLADDYRRMADYWLQGGSDPARPALYRRLLGRVYVLYANVAHHRRMKAAPYLQSLYTRVRQQRREWSLAAIRQELEDFVSNVALLELEPEHTRQQKSDALYRDHQRGVNQLFEYVLTSRQWTDGVGSLFTDMLAAPTIDNVDQQLLVAAVTLALMNQFDMAKFRTLTDVYRLSADEAVRQRALVGWVLALSDDTLSVYPEQRDIVAALVDSDDVCQQLTELQLQLVYCLNEENDRNIMRREIMPDLMKNNNFTFDGKQLQERDDDPMEDILHPDAAEERMEKLEATFRRMMDMQRQGSDIYFGGFSQMKRFPFFYDISNWLVPFYLQHPDIAQYVSKLGDNKFIQKAVSHAPFCSSDRYSFLIAFQQVMDRLPDNVREMMKRGEAHFGTEIDDVQELRSAAYYRRAYLMDLYRFFRLFPHSGELRNPFDRRQSETGDCEFFSLRVFDHTPLEHYKSQVVRLLKKLHLDEAAQHLLATYKDDCCDVQYYLWTAQYDRILATDPDHERALDGKARDSFRQGDYRTAATLYGRLVGLHPDKMRYQLYQAVCLVRQEDYDAALKLLYKLNYEYPDDLGVCRVLAWCLMSTGKPAQAARLYDRLLAAETPEADDKTHAGYCLWLQGRIAEAADLLRGSTDLDTAWLRDRGVSDVDIKMMQAQIGL